MKHGALAFVFAAFASVAQAQVYGPGAVSYEGVLYSGGSPFSGPATFTLRLLDGAGTCVIREETFSQTLAADGRFSLTLGQGTSIGPNGALSLRQLMANGGAIFGAGSCAADVSSGKGRFIHVVANGIDLSPDVPIGSSPYAMVADSLQGKEPSSFLMIDGTSQMTQTNAAATFLYLFGGGGANWTALQSLVGGTSSVYLKAGANGAATVPTFSGSPSSPTQGQMWFDLSANQLKYYNGSTIQTVAAGGAGTVTSVVAGAGLVGGPISTSGTLSVDVGATAGKIVQLNASAQLPAVSGALLTSLDAGQISSGSLAIARGGTGLTTAPATGQILLGSGVGTWSLFGCATNGQVLAWNVGTGFGCANVGTVAGSSGQVQFNSAGTFAAANLFWSQGNGSLGIQTASPLAALDVSATGPMSAILVPRDTTANRPAVPYNGMIRYNTTAAKFEAYENGAWINMIGAGSALTTGTLASGIVSNGSVGMVYAPSTAPGSVTAIGNLQAIAYGGSFSISSGTLMATKSEATFSGPAALGDLRGVDGSAEAKGTGIAQAIRGVRGSAINSGNSTVPTAIGVEGLVQTKTSGAAYVTNGFAFLASVPSGSAPVDTAVGLGVNGVYGGSTAIGVMIQNLAAGASWGIYEVDPAPNYFNGPVRIGPSPMIPTALLEVAGGTANISIVPKNVSLKAEDANLSSTGAPAKGGDILLTPGTPAAGGSFGAVRLGGPTAFNNGAAVQKVDRVTLSASSCSPTASLVAGTGVGCANASYTLPAGATATYFVCAGASGSALVNATGVAQGAAGAAVNVALSGPVASGGPTGSTNISFNCMATSF